MTQSDQSGQDGPARRPSGTGRSSTTTADKPGSRPESDRTSSSSDAAAKSAGSAKGSTGSTAAPKSGAAASIVSRVAAAGSKDRAGDPARKPRRARLRLTQVDAWTVLKTTFLLSIAMGIVSIVAVAVIWTVLGVAGVFDSMNDTIQSLLGNDFRIQDYIGTGRILGFTMIFAVVNVVLLTAIGTLAAFLYNLAATLLGGVEVTLTEDR
ncbi:hypothetical protein GCM10011519_21770 [Marmoricola endophyticus]|uniref:DUF3566 domain-containing protein n=1 Tax=Marmoricola endophyticus TaxID=2040280 RepID=A0A917F4D1_9ACTN|nr:DUF3566 domain-containing protein [Marmoricola endophyticus]GGF47352.1 hypothetical protein GCM10011519_21770 [Marmoricola endophyticus]